MKTRSTNAENLHRSRETLVLTRVKFFLIQKNKIFGFFCAFTRFNNLLQMIDFHGAGHIYIYIYIPNSLVHSFAE